MDACRSADEIDPNTLYPVAQARRFIPGPKGGCVGRLTLYEYRRKGLIACVDRAVKGQTWHFVWGAELLRFLGAKDRPEWRGRTPAQTRKAAEAALEELRRKGVRV